MRRAFFWLLLFGTFPMIAFAGPNAGGTLVLSDAYYYYPYPPGHHIFNCGLGTHPASCQSAASEVDGHAGNLVMIKIYAAFPEGAAPRLMGLTFGINYDPALIGIYSWVSCGDFELPDFNWPMPGSGNSVTYNQLQTAALVLVGFLLVDRDGTPGTVELTPNPTQGGWFGDDSVPAVLDSIAGYSAMGFDRPGRLVCPGPAPLGACCQLEGSCTFVQPAYCTSPGMWHGEWMTCQPDPCPVPPFGACCFADGSCTYEAQFYCASPAVWHGEWAGCDPDPCPGVCCFFTGVCAVTAPGGCAGAGVWHPEWRSCNPTPCLGACCLPHQECLLTVQTGCASPGVWHPEWVSCSPNPCPLPVLRACCDPFGGCVLFEQTDCQAPGVWHADWGSCVPDPCQAPPTPFNQGGVLVVHDAGLLLAATDGSVPVCGQGAVLDQCRYQDVRVDGASSAAPAVFKVYAAFPSTTARLMGVTWGIDFDLAKLIVAASGTCGDFELNDIGWPCPHCGSTVIWSAPQTQPLVPVYWFAAYRAGDPSLFRLGPHPTQGGMFGDDAVPSHLEPIAGYGAMGFDLPGIMVCPGTVAAGACCDRSGACTMVGRANCLAPSIWMGAGTSCDTGPCFAVPVRQSSWGRIKYSYR